MTDSPTEQPSHEVAPTQRVEPPAAARPTAIDGAFGDRPTPTFSHSSNATAAVPASPLSFGRYDLLAELGRGGMGVVWKAWDNQLKRHVALKQILPAAGSDPELGERFLREARLAAKLRHPGIVAVHDVGQHDGKPYFTSDFIAGRPLNDCLRESVPVQRSLAWIRAVAEALQHAHSEGVIHRDIKPSNILLDERDRPYVTDFGLAKEVDSLARTPTTAAPLTVSGTLLGTPEYMSPEQASGRIKDVGPMSDQFSLGVVLYELLTGRLPFVGNGMREILNAITEREPVPPGRVRPRLHRDIETICLKALEKDPARRYASIGAMGADLGRYLEGEPIQARPAGPFLRLARRISRTPGLTGGLLSAGTVIWLLFSMKFVNWWQDGKATRADIAAGTRALLDDDPDAAIEVLAHAAGRDKDNPEIQRLLESAHARQAERHQKEFERAGAAALSEHDAKRARALPDYLHAEELREKARVLAQKGKLGERQNFLQEAEESYGRALAVDADFAEAAAGRGRALADLGDAPHALADLERALKLRPEDTDALLTRLMVRTEQYESLWARSGKLDTADITTLGKFPDLTGDPEADELKRAIKDDIGRLLGMRVKPELALYFKGWLARIDGDLEAAGKCFDDSIGLWAYFAEGYEGRGTSRLLRPDADLDVALKDLQEAIRLDPGCFRARFMRAIVLVRKSEMMHALSEVNVLIQIRPRFAPMFVARGYIQEHLLHEVSHAEGDYRQAIALDPACLVAFINLANILGNAGKNAEAYDVLAQALRVNDRYAYTFLERAKILRALLRPEEALADLERALTIDSDFAPAYGLRGQLRQARKETAAALADYDRSLTLDPKGFDVRVARAQLYCSLERYGEVLADSEILVAASPDGAAGLSLRGTAKAKLGDRDGALADFLRAQEVDPKCSQAVYGAGALLAERQRDAEALEFLDRAVVLLPDYADATLQRAFVLYRLGRFPKAVAGFERALALGIQADQVEQVKSLLELARKSAEKK